MFRLATFKAQFVRSPDCASVFSHTSFSDISLPRSRIFLKYVIFRLFFVASVAIDHFQRNGVVFLLLLTKSFKRFKNRLPALEINQHSVCTYWTT